MKSPNVLLLSLAIATVLSACTGDKAPAANAGVATPKAELPPLAAFNIADLDTSKNACTNLADFVNSKWLAANPVPGDKTSWGSFEMLDERSEAASKALVEAAAARKDASGLEKLVGDIYATGMDEAAIEAAGITPVKPMLDRIDALKTPADIAGYLRDEFAAGRGEVFGFYPQADFKNSDMVIAYADQGGLSLPEKAYYLEDGPDGKYKTIREAFVAHIAKQLENAGVAADAAQQQAKDVLAFETRLAKASFSRIELRDPNKQYHLVSVADADKASPNFSWSQFFAANGLKVENFSLSQPKFFVAFNKMLTDVPVEQWQAYLRISAIDGMAPYLAAKFNDERFDFYSQTLRGQKEQKARWKRVLDTVEGTSGEALGQLYVKEYFPAESKAAMEALVGNLRDALKVRLEKLDWMSPETKAKAMEKWASFTPKIGYPDKWRSWDGLATSRDGYVQNVLAASRFNHDFEMAKTADDIERIFKAGRIASLIGIEGGHQIDNSLPVLRQMYVLGVRYMTLTHTLNTDWADSATDNPLHHGLTPFGRAVVGEMNRLGMLVDLSHVSAETMRTALETSKAPVIFSHSGARALIDHPRNIPDDVLRTVKRNHGIVMVDFYPAYISAAYARWSADRAAEATRYNAPPYDGLYIGQPERAKAALATWDRQNPPPVVTIGMVADHLDHIRKIAGVESVGIGSDFDGIGTTPKGLDGVDKYPALFLELARRGWTDEEMADLAGRNILRVMREAEAVAKRLQTEEGPSNATIEMDTNKKQTNQKG